MKHFATFLLWPLLFSFSCGNENKPIEKVVCQITDSRMVGKWKLYQECTTDGFGGPHVWTKTSDDFAFDFDSKCNARFTDTDSNCTTGTYSVNRNQLSVIWNCKYGNASNFYTYKFNTQSDTLILYPPPDIETCCGYIYIKQP
jgi:hypothetical protein